MQLDIQTISIKPMINNFKNSILKLILIGILAPKHSQNSKTNYKKESIGITLEKLKY